MPVDSPAARAVESRFASRVLEQHRSQGRSNDCGPFSTAMVINALCSPGLDPERLARQLDHVRWVGPFPLVRRIPQWATFPWGVVDALRLHGLHASWRPFCKPESLVAWLTQGKIPLVFIGGIRPLWGHVMVLLVRDPLLGWGFADPAWPAHELHWLPDSTFRPQFRTFANTAVLVTI